MRPRFAGSREVLARALLAIRRRALSLFNELLDFLPTFLSDAFVEVRAITIARGFAALLSTLLADLLVELMTVSLLGRQAALAADLFVELRAVLMLDRLAAFLAGFPDRHTTAAAVLFRNHLFYHLCRLCRPRRAASSLHLLQRTLRPESLGPRLVGDEKTRLGGGSKQARRSEQALGVQQDGHRPGVRQPDGHLRPELAESDCDAALRQDRSGQFVKAAGQRFLGGGDKGWPAPTPGVSVQRELRDHERRAAGFEQRTVHQAVVVGENPQSRDLLAHRARVGFVVVAGDAEQH